jgi:hypothetical protein
MAVAGLVRKMLVPIELDVRLTGRVQPVVEVRACYVNSEALQNVVKHTGGCAATSRWSGAAEALSSRSSTTDRAARQCVRADGCGLVDRVEAVGGRVEVDTCRNACWLGRSDLEPPASLTRNQVRARIVPSQAVRERRARGNPGGSAQRATQRPTLACRFIVRLTLPTAPRHSPIYPQ